MTKEKESGLTKLIELLNEYLRETKKAELYDFYIKGDYIVCDFLSTVEDYGYVINSRIEMDYGDEILISKSLGFIKWLVENEKVEENSDLITLASELGCAFSSDVLLMYLAIQDEPINFLLEILK